MFSALYDIAIMQNYDFVCLLDSGETVGDDEAGLVLCQFVYRLLNERFGSTINAARRLV